MPPVDRRPRESPRRTDTNCRRYGITVAEIYTGRKSPISPTLDLCLAPPMGMTPWNVIKILGVSENESPSVDCVMIGQSFQHKSSAWQTYRQTNGLKELLHQYRAGRSCPWWSDDNGWLLRSLQRQRVHRRRIKNKGFPYSLPRVGSGADPGVQAVSL